MRSLPYPTPGTVVPLDVENSQHDSAVICVEALRARPKGSVTPTS
jgi:hypothetical protein